MMKRLMGDEELPTAELDAFLKDIPRQIRDLGAFLDAGDVTSAGLKARAIRGAAADVGGVALAGGGC
jgi:hypothetical protein